MDGTSASAQYGRIARPPRVVAVPGGVGISEPSCTRREEIPRINRPAEDPTETGKSLNLKYYTKIDAPPAQAPLAAEDEYDLDPEDELVQFPDTLYPLKSSTDSEDIPRVVPSTPRHTSDEVSSLAESPTFMLSTSDDEEELNTFNESFDSGLHQSHHSLQEAGGIPSIIKNTIFGKTKNPSSPQTIPRRLNQQEMYAFSDGCRKYSWRQPSLETINQGQSPLQRPISAHYDHLALPHLSSLSQMGIRARSSEVLRCRPRTSSSASSPGLNCYGFRPRPTTTPQHLLPYGKGYCLIIAEFTDDLTGYAEDAAHIEDFHRNTLHYEVDTHFNLCQKELLHVLKTAVQKLNTDPMYDRFFLYILSHGCEKGVYTCVQDPEVKGQECFIEETNKSKTVSDDTHDNILITDFDYIVALFHHTNLNGMSHFPKVFVFQACRGEGHAKAAGKSARVPPIEHSMSTTVLASPQLRRSGLPQGSLGNRKYCSDGHLCGTSKLKVTEGADELVCYACVDGTKSWVPETGSVFIQEILDGLDRFYALEHLADIMVGVNQTISRKSICRVARQMPEFKSRLTKKFYLKIPEAYIQANVQQVDNSFHYHEEY